MDLIKRFSKNTHGQQFVVGDVHGCFTKLQEALDQIGFDESVDRLFCVGDLVDRCSESHLFTDWLDKPWFHSVRGNHENLLIGNYEGDSNLLRCHMMNGGGWYEAEDDATRERMYNACKQLPYIIEVETDNGLVGIIHADTGHWADWDAFKQAVAASDSVALETCVWSRRRIDRGENHWISGIGRLYVGHTPRFSSVTLGNVVYLDTYGWCGGEFTIVRL